MRALQPTHGLGVSPLRYASTNGATTRSSNTAAQSCTTCSMPKHAQTAAASRAACIDFSVRSNRQVTPSTS